MFESGAHISLVVRVVRISLNLHDSAVFLRAENSAIQMTQKTRCSLDFPRDLSHVFLLSSSRRRLGYRRFAASILFIPYFGHAGRIVCGAIAVGAFAYATLMEWTDLVVSNAEFQLYPVKRYAMGRLAQWTGFALGVVVAFFAFRAGDVAIEGLGELSCVIAIIVVAAF